MMLIYSVKKLSRYYCETFLSKSPTGERTHMKCPNCDNHEFERLDYAIVRCTNCLSLWDPYIYPGFPKPTVEIGQIWDTTWDDEDEEN